MIFDDRLLTALPFYDDRGKQSFRQEKCFRNLHTWQQLTDLRHLPPFEIVTDCTGTSCSGSSWELYNTTDTLVQDLEHADYDICSLIDEYTGNDKDGDFKKWFIYDGAFCTDLPTGLHYIKATIDTCIYYSEVFNICVPKSTAFEDSAEVFSSWGNVDLDTFASSGIDITDTDHASGVGRANTDEFCGITGDIFDYEFDVSWTTKPVQDAISMYLALPADITTPISNTILFTSEITYSGQFTTTSDGTYVLVWQAVCIVGIVNVVIDCSLTRRVYLPDYSNNIVLEYGHTCDIGNIVYQYGFQNKIIFDSKVDLVKPTYETIKSGESREGYFFVNNAVTKKTYKMVFYAPEYMADAMSILELHDNITITDKNDDSISVDEINVNSTPAGNCFFKIDIEIITDPLSSSNCCSDLILS